MTEDVVDAHPIKLMVSWLDGEARSIPGRAMSEHRSTTDISDLKRRIAAGEYRLDASAIADAMFGRADQSLAAERSEMLEPGELDGPSGGVDQF